MIMMDGMYFGRSAVSRSISASAAERTLLLGALATHMGVLDTRENDATTVLRKSELWDGITSHFNSNTSTPRSRQQIQTLYKNMKAKARRYESRLAEMQNGIPPPDPDPISEMLLGLLHQQLRHQQRQIRSLVARDTNGLTLDFNQQDSNSHSSFVQPEQMMQVSLSEGATEDLDVKSETFDYDFSTADLADENLVRQDDDDEKPSVTNEHGSSDGKESLQSVGASSGGVSPSRDVIMSPPSPTTAEVNPNNDVLSPTSHSAAAEDSSSTSFSYSSTPTVNIPRPQYPLPSTPADLFAALKQRLSPDDATNNLVKAAEERRNDNLSQTPKRPRVEAISNGCQASILRSFSSCCPELHAKVLSIAQEEHHLKKAILQKDQEMREEEHKTRMKILALEEEGAKMKIARMKVLLDRETSSELNNINDL